MNWRHSIYVLLFINYAYTLESLDCEFDSFTYLNCKNCDSIGCVECQEEFYLTLHQNKNKGVCTYFSIKMNCRKKIIQYRGKDLNYCFVESNSSKNASSSIIFIIIFTLLGFSVILGLIVFIIIKMKKQNQLKISKMNKSIHSSCSTCSSLEIDKRRLNCGGHLCFICFEKSKQNLKTGFYPKCLHCSKLVIWYINEENNFIDKDDIKLELMIKNSEEFEFCVLCNKTDVPESVVPCPNRPLHKSHINCLINYISTNSILENLSHSIICPICKGKLS